MPQDSLPLVIVGHVDHGKSTLIGRLLLDTGMVTEAKKAEVEAASKAVGKEFEPAFLMDHLEEERDEGITIDTAQLFFRTEKRMYVIIDAPGHREFIRNMITGAAQAETAILVMDAEEGIREQTRRHAFFLSLLGLSQIVVLVNKMDRLDYSKKEFDRLSKEIRAFLKELGIEPSFVIPASAYRGDNVVTRSEKMAWYEGPLLLEALDTFTKSRGAEERDLRYPVQDIYEVDGRSLVAGRVEAGSLRPGDRVTLLPSGECATVKSIEMFQKVLDGAVAGQSVGITLEDGAKPGRGQICCPHDKPAPVTDTFSADLFWMSPKPLAESDTIRIRCTTQEVPIRIETIRARIDSSTLERIERSDGSLQETEVAQVVLKTERPIVVDPFDPALGKFVLERGDEVVAGGIVSRPSA